MFWMMIVARGIAGFGAGGEYPTCGTSSAEASDESPNVRKRRGILVALATDFAIDLGFVGAGIVALVVLACYHQKTSDGIWRICFGLGIVVSTLQDQNYMKCSLIFEAASLNLYLPSLDSEFNSVPKTRY